MLKTGKREYLVTTVLENSQETARLYVDFYDPPNPEKIDPNYLLAEIYLLTNSSSYYCTLLRSDIVLSWNLNLYHKLHNVFSEKSASLIVGFDSEARFLTVSTQNELRAIRFLLFQKPSITRLDSNPSSRMQLLMAKFYLQKENILAELTKKQEQEREYLNKIDSLSRQVKDVGADDMQRMKDRFIPLINQVKEELRTRRNQDDEQPLSAQEIQGDEHAEKSEEKNKKMLKILGRKKQFADYPKEKINQTGKNEGKLCIQDQFLDIL